MSILHLAPTEAIQWKDDETYLPKDFERDGFIHCCPGGAYETLVGIANLFYKSIPGDFTVLVLDIAILEAAGSRVVFEAPAGVGGIAHDDSVPSTLMPHVYGPIHKKAVLETKSVTRDGDNFVSIN